MEKTTVIKTERQKVNKIEEDWKIEKRETLNWKEKNKKMVPNRKQETATRQRAERNDCKANFIT